MDGAMRAEAGGSLTEQIADRLADQIIRGERGPKSRIQELTLAKQLGVSRGSVREALLILERRHLIEILPRRGAVVTDFPAEEMRQFSELYSLLQKRLFKLCARHSGVARSALAPLLTTMTEARGNADMQALADARAGYLSAALDAAGDHYLDRVLRPLIAVGQRLSARAGAHPEFDPDDVLRYYRALTDAIDAGSDERVDELVSAFSQRELHLARA